MIKVVRIRLPLDYTENDLKRLAAMMLKTDETDIESCVLTRRKTINKDKNDVHFEGTVNVKLSDKLIDKDVIIHSKCKNASLAEDNTYCVPKIKTEKRPVVIGFGPAGIFASLVLAEAGAAPIVLERGYDIARRSNDVSIFHGGGKLNTSSNIQFGEGGAGAFSDGKLKTGYVDARKFKILTEFVLAGADESILYLEKAHIGSDRLHTAVKNLREKIISLGAHVRFGCRLTKIIKKNGRICAVGYECGSEYNEIETDNVILAIGHSARDTIEYLYSEGIQMQQKNFAVGVRIEHPQSLINKLQYGKSAGHPALGSADYKLVTHLKNGRSVYTFCMCPGGYVVAAASEENGICTNGMSEFARDSQNANTAMLVSITPADFGSDHPLAGIEYQRTIEHSGFISGGGNYFAPVQRLEDFINNTKTTRLGDVRPTYTPGTVSAPLSDYLPRYITDSLKQGLLDMFDWMPGYYYADALLTGPETRTTSPVRLSRTEALEAVGTNGLYPCGEGAGYAGGIISAAVDGMLCAEKIIQKYTGI
ncbi:MAG: hypothetical protein Q4F95_02420 [Oscillospiraceae bacterium]|nr:hypothetical protein [Oscillospiraceae bacterium]